MDIYRWLPVNAVKIALVLFLSFLLGLEREERKAAATSYYAFGGVRTFPLIGLIGYSIALLSGTQLLPVIFGFLGVASFLLLAYWHKLGGTEPAGVTSEMSGLATYLIGALVCYGHLWIATSLAVVSLLLLELKTVLENLARSSDPRELITFSKFLVLTAVILPILPNQQFGPFHINPYQTWLVVVAVSAISYGSYWLQRVTKQRGGIVLAALLGGAYSSTLTTVVLAKRAAREERTHLFSGAILIASGVMYLRLIALLAIFNRRLLEVLARPFLLLAVIAIATGWLWSRRADPGGGEVRREYQPENPLELRAAFLFAFLFLVMYVATQLATTYFGNAGVDLLAAVMGVTDVDPFILGMTQVAGSMTPLRAAASAIVIAAASNNLIKGIYSFVFAGHRTGLQSMAMLTGLAIAGILPLLWI